MKPLFPKQIDDLALLSTGPLGGIHNLAVAANRQRIAEQYESYRLSVRWPTRGHPPITDELKSSLHKKYSEGRSGAGNFTFIRDLAIQPGTNSCPYCGRLGLGTIDHYLPKEDFAWYSVFSLNLVPSCYGCQLVKGAKVGPVNGVRAMHPYLDRFGLSQKVAIRTFLDARDVSSGRFRWFLQEARRLERRSKGRFSRRVRKREKHLFHRHLTFFGAKRIDVTASCRIALADIRIELDRNACTNLGDSRAWIREGLSNSQKSEDVGSETLIRIGLLRGFYCDTKSLTELLASPLPVRELTRLQQGKLLRKR